MDPSMIGIENVLAECGNDFRCSAATSARLVATGQIIAVRDVASPAA
jgi:hypothetical protein